MAETHDTIDGLLAEFRGYSAGMPASYHVTMSWADFRKMLDRLDAAHKREVAVSKTETTTNAVKLREALKQVNELNDLWFDTFAIDGATSIHDEIEDVISAALAAPPRNCDRFASAEEAAKAWNERKFKDPCVVCKGCTFDRGPESCAPGADCEIGWLYAEAKEGGAKWLGR